MVACIFLLFAGWGAYVGIRNFRGIAPAILNPPEDIAGLIEEKSGKDPLNMTGFPLRLPERFSMSVFARDLDAPRVLVRDPNGVMLASVPSKGRIVALPDRDSDGAADEVEPVLDGLERPHGMAFRCGESCSFFVAEEGSVSEYDYDANMLKAVNRRKLVDLPDDGGHFTRTLLFLPYPNEDILLISVGSSCNVCAEKDERRAKILAYDLNSGSLAPYASGLRNSVFMTIHPVTGSVFATEMGRDWLGDDLPPDEINIIRDGQNYGWPFCFGKRIIDEDFRGTVRFAPPDSACDRTEPSAIDLPAHSAPLGLSFIPEEGWPEEYWHDLLVAYHGSWNRSAPTGYKIARFKFDGAGNFESQEDFISGWLVPGGALGRPVDIMTEPGGVMYVSDDKAGVIYRIFYRPDMDI